MNDPNTCPICKRTWVISFRDDVLVPACGCFGRDPWSLNAPCEKDGLAHALSCPNMPDKEASK